MEQSRISSKVAFVKEFRAGAQQMLRSVCAPPNWKGEFLLIALQLSPPTSSSKFRQNLDQLNSIYEESVGGEVPPFSLCQGSLKCVITHG